MAHFYLLIGGADDGHTHLRQAGSVLRGYVYAQLGAVHDGEKAAAEGDVHFQLSQFRYVYRRAFFIQEGGHVFEGDLFGAAVLHLDADGDQTGRGLHADDGLRLFYLHHAGLHQNGVDGDGAVAAHVVIAIAVHEDNADVRVRPAGRGQQAAEHVLMAPGLLHQGPAQVVVMLDEVFPLLRDGTADQIGEPAHDQAQGLAHGVGVHREHGAFGFHKAGCPFCFTRAAWRRPHERAGRCGRKCSGSPFAPSEEGRPSFCGVLPAPRRRPPAAPLP